MTEPEAAQTLPQFVASVDSAYGDSDAVVFGERAMTFRQLDEWSALIAQGLLKRGVGKGTRVGFLFGNDPDWVVFWAAITRMGAIAVPLSTFLKADELVRTLRHADVHGLFIQRTLPGQDLVTRVGRAVPELDSSPTPDLMLQAVPFLRWIVAVGGPAPESWAHDVGWLVDDNVASHGALLREAESEVHPEDPAMEIYTSGVVALPKGVLHTHGAIMAKAHWVADVSEFTRGSRQALNMPLFWIGGFMMTLLPALQSGAVTVCAERPTSDSRMAFGSVIPSDVLETMPQPRLIWALGMTETLGPYSMGNELRVDGYPLCAPLDSFAPGCVVKVVDEHGELVPDGATGEIVVRAPTVTVGLHKTPRESVFDADGFFRTGDLGSVDGARIHFVGRKGDMIKTSGANVAPAEVEMEMQNLDGVDSAYIVAIPDTQRGQIVAAAVVRSEGSGVDAAELQAELRTRLSSYKVPRAIVFLERDEVPLTPSNKVNKRLIGQMIADVLPAEH